MRFEKKVVLVTGASSGIGRALAVECAKEGANLVLCARRVDRLIELKKQIESFGSRAIVVECDVCRKEDLDKAVQVAIREFSRLDIVIANAGFGVVGQVDNLELEDFRRQFETNVFALIETVKVSLPEIKKTRGCLVLMGSVSGYVSVPGSAPYSMSKFAVRAFADSLYFEMKAFGVGVTLISPGFVESEIRQVDNQGRLHPGKSSGAPEWIIMPVELAARKMLRAIFRRKRELIVTGHGKIAVFFQRHFPGVLSLAIRFGLRSRGQPK